MTNELLRERIAGSLYGLLCGDALGCPVETWEPARIVAEYGELRTMEPTRDRPRPAGLHSDDGQQAMALCDALLLEPEAPEAELLRLFVALYRGSPRRGDGHFGLHRGTGSNFRAFVKLLDSGATAREAAQPSAGNGVAMLIAPVAWYWRGDLDRLGDVALRVGALKQRDVRGVAAGGAVAYLIDHALRRGGLADLDEDALLEFVRAVEAGAARHHASPPSDVFSRALADMLAARGGRRQAVLERITENARRTSNRDCGPADGYAPASVVTSIYMALDAPSYERAVIDTVHLGGDADTTGAIVGAIAGACHGRAAIPAAWYDALVARGAFDDRLDPLVERARGFRPAESLVDTERRLGQLHAGDGAPELPLNPRCKCV